MKEITLTCDQIRMIVDALKTNVAVNQGTIDRIYHEITSDNQTIEKAKEDVAYRIVERNMCMRNLLDYIESV